MEDSPSSPLLTHTQQPDDEEEEHQSLVHQKRAQRAVVMAFVGSFMVLSLLIGYIAGPVYWSPQPIYSNGTHAFGRTVIVFSIDGMRAEYLERGLTPTLHNMSTEGVRAEYLEPSFPSTTFANHYSLVTGLYPESHGIVGNTFYDPVLNDTFNYVVPAQSWDTKWWKGEPLWVTVVKQHKKSAVHMWPGGSSVIQSTRPTYWDDFDDSITLGRKIQRVMEWIDLPLEQRPNLITVYVSDVDKQGHKYGVDSVQVNDALRRIEDMFALLQSQLVVRNLTDIVNLVVVSDHGMTNVPPGNVLDVSDFVDMDRIQAIHGFPLAHVWPLTAADEPYLYAALFNASQGQEWKVYRKADVPSYLHHRHSDRIAPIVAIPPLGWIFGRKNAFDGHGMHGYDPRLEAMHAVFIARGPAFIRSQGKPAPYFSNTQVYGILARVLDVHAAPNNGSEFWLDRSGLLKGNG